MPKRSRLNAPSGAQCFPTVFDGVPDTDYQSQCTFWCSVLSDKNPYRQKAKALSSQCTFWCSVLSDLGTWLYGSGALLGSQCTFWCSVLSDPDRPQAQPSGVCLNAPSGAQCFPTHGCRAGRGSVRVVSMHLLVLSAFRLQSIPSPTQTATSQCTFWCSVLSDQLTLKRRRRHNRSQCTFWCSVLSDSKTQSLLARPITVSMHLLVLSAFRLRPQKTAPQRRLPERNRRRPGKHHIESARTCPIKPHNREIPPQTTPAPPTPLPTSTPPTFNEPKPKNRRLTTTSR